MITNIIMISVQSYDKNVVSRTLMTQLIMKIFTGPDEIKIAIGAIATIIMFLAIGTPIARVNIYI